ncbi:MAG: ribosomal protein L7/L12 [Enhygromyxa sp.]
METFRIRYLHGASPISAIQLVREFMGIGRRDAKEVVETRGLILDRVSAAEARRVVRRFAEIGAQVEVERTWRHVLAYDPSDPARGDQPIQRLRAGELELVLDHGQLGAIELGEPELFDDEALTQRRVIAQLERWTAAGLSLADSELAVLGPSASASASSRPPCASAPRISRAT